MLQAISLLGYLVFAVRISVTDLKYRLIYHKDLFVLLAFIATLGLNGIDSPRSFDQIALVTLVLGVFFLIFGRHIGAGDIKLFWVMSFWSESFVKWLQLFSFAWVLGGIFTLATVLLHRRISGSIPFAPFIFIAFFSLVAP
jgi:Flp pilus assembly protein protease CpaA